MGGSGDGTFGYIEAGLPNIEGNFSGCGQGYQGSINSNGAFSIGRQSGLGGSNGLGGVHFFWCNFNASRYNSIYGKSKTVQPPAVKFRVKTRFK